MVIAMFPTSQNNSRLVQYNQTPQVWASVKNLRVFPSNTVVGQILPNNKIRWKLSHSSRSNSRWHRRSKLNNDDFHIIFFSHISIKISIIGNTPHPLDTTLFLPTISSPLYCSSLVSSHAPICSSQSMWSYWPMISAPSSDENFYFHWSFLTKGTSSQPMTYLIWSAGTSHISMLCSLWIFVLP